MDEMMERFLQELFLTHRSAARFRSLERDGGREASRWPVIGYHSLALTTFSIRQKCVSAPGIQRKAGDGATIPHLTRQSRSLPPPGSQLLAERVQVAPGLLMACAAQDFIQIPQQLALIGDTKVGPEDWHVLA